MSQWKFYIDVGGTFTDVVAVSPEGQLRTYKLLSSGAVRGHAKASKDRTRLIDPSRVGDPPNFWLDYTLHLLGRHQAASPHHPIATSITGFDPATGTLTLAQSMDMPEFA